jgi:hypothetical protein
MKTIFLLFFAPLILFLELTLFGWIVELLRAPSDVAVIAGILLICLAITGNYYLIKLIKTQLNKKQ